MDLVHATLIVVVAATVAALSTPVVIRFARQIDAVDRPNERKVSNRAGMPLLGGLAVSAGATAAFVAAQLFGLAPPGVMGKVWVFALGAFVLMLAGAWDDRFNLGAFKKLAIQIVVAAFAIQSGFAVDLFSNPFVDSGVAQVPGWILWPVSLVWIVGVTNAMNLIDGLDGLSSGLGAIISLTLAIICWEAGQWVGVVIGLTLFGALMGYLPFNFPPARIFLGDTGSLVIGYGLALIALEGYRKTAILAFLVPVLALAIPLLDTLLSIVRRLRSGRGVFSADRLHMHHRLLHREGSHKNAVLMLYFLTGCFCMIAVSFTQLDGWVAFLYLAAVVAVTIRLLRNLDAFSLDVGAAGPIPERPEGAESVDASGRVAAGAEPGARQPADGDPS